MIIVREQSYGLGVEGVKEPFGPRLGAPVPIAVSFDHFWDVLDGATVELFEDLGTYARSFQSPEGEKAWSCPFHSFLGVFGPR
jgi:hypothetical protein